ncbi:MAG: FAD-dependent thymidylate synthase [Chloroflexi bacterium]|nr:FAD-dependent thymidylate synthase [Chloroflexota bacterium]
MKVYAVAGVPPEIQAYAMARYSRSAQSMLDSIGELSTQRAEQFLNTFYFQYGHRSIADLAHLVLGIEDVSILAATRVVDEPLWDGQERSTRYQPFKKTGYFTPPELEGDALRRYQIAADALFAAYAGLTDRLFALLVERVPRPEALDRKAFERTLRARAFDVSRSILPLATITSLGQVVSARVLERQISRLLSDPLPEVRRIGEALKRACREPAATPLGHGETSRHGAGSISHASEAAASSDANGTRANGHTYFASNGSASDDSGAEGTALAPTLVKYAAPSPYLIETRAALERLAARLLAPPGVPDRSATVELGDEMPPTDEAVTTLLYRYDLAGHSYRQVQERVRVLSEAEKREVLQTAIAHRGRHDELLREFQSGYAFAFDILMDFGSFRDLHRHRRCVQIVQEPTAGHGAEPAAEVFPRAFGPELGAAALAAGCGEAYDAAIDAGLTASREFATEAAGSPARLAAPYLLPLAARTRALFKMDAAQAAYITELRTGPSGHFSYRRVAWEMYLAFRQRSPELAALARPTDPTEPIDLLQR